MVPCGNCNAATGENKMCKRATISDMKGNNMQLTCVEEQTITPSMPYKLKVLIWARLGQTVTPNMLNKLEILSSTWPNNIQYPVEIIGFKCVELEHTITPNMRYKLKTVSLAWTNVNTQYGL